jgi:hypothetical protein
VVDDPGVFLHELPVLPLLRTVPLHPAQFEVVHVGDETRAEREVHARRAGAEVVAFSNMIFLPTWRS